MGVVCVYAVLGQLEGKPTSADAIGQDLYAGAAVSLSLNLAVLHTSKKGIIQPLEFVRINPSFGSSGAYLSYNP